VGAYPRPATATSTGRGRPRGSRWQPLARPPGAHRGKRDHFL